LNWLVRLILTLFGQHLKLKLVYEAKRKGLAAYMRAIQGTRRLMILVLVGALMLQLMMLSAVGALVTGFLLWDHDFQAKIEILFWIFSAMFAVPAGLLTAIFSERLWYKASGAKRMMDELKKSA